MTELLIANKTSGQIWDVVSCIDGDLNLSSERIGVPGSMDFTVILKGDLTFEPGDIVRFSVDGKLLFYGYIFTMQPDRWGRCYVLAYDRLRYLKASASYAFYALTAGDIIKQIAEDLQLDVGAIEDTGYKIPSLIENNKTCIDIIQDALSQTLLNTGILYIFYDDGDGLALRAAGVWYSDIILGDRSLVTDFSYQKSIDTNVYNSVKLAQPNKTTGKADVVVVQDSANIGKWGLLQLYQSVDTELNEAQLAARAKETLTYYNKIHRTLILNSVGIDGLRAGMMIRVLLPSVGTESIAAWVLLESVYHVYSNGLHTMELEALELTDDLITDASAN